MTVNLRTASKKITENYARLGLDPVRDEDAINRMRVDAVEKLAAMFDGFKIKTAEISNRGTDDTFFVAAQYIDARKMVQKAELQVKFTDDEPVIPRRVRMCDARNPNIILQGFHRYNRQLVEDKSDAARAWKNFVEFRQFVIETAFHAYEFDGQSGKDFYGVKNKIADEGGTIVIANLRGNGREAKFCVEFQPFSATIASAQAFCNGVPIGPLQTSFPIENLIRQGYDLGLAVRKAMLPEHKITLREAPQRKAIFERTMRYDVLLNGKVVNDCHFNMEGYNTLLPLPGGRMFHPGEISLGKIKKEIAEINNAAKDPDSWIYQKDVIEITRPFIIKYGGSEKRLQINGLYDAADLDDPRQIVKAMEAKASFFMERWLLEDTRTEWAFLGKNSRVQLLADLMERNGVAIYDSPLESLEKQGANEADAPDAGF